MSNDFYYNIKVHVQVRSKIYLCGSLKLRQVLTTKSFRSSKNNHK